MSLAEKKVNKNLEVFDTSVFLIPTSSLASVDVAMFLYQALVVKEKDFRSKVELIEANEFKDKYVRIHNSMAAIVPEWSYMLLADKLLSEAAYVQFAADENDFMEQAIWHNILTYNYDKYVNQKVVIKGCGNKFFKTKHYLALYQCLMSKCKQISFGEACSMVPIGKK